MAKRNSNIAYNAIDNDKPTVQRQDDKSSIDNEPTDGVENPDGSTTVSATPKEPSGRSTTENMPTNLLNPEIQQFKAETNHPEDWTDSELLAVAQQRRAEDLSTEEISDRVNVSEAVVRRGLRKKRYANLKTTDEIRDEFLECTATQRLVIAANLAGAPDYARSDLAEMAGCKQGSVGSTRRRFRPLIRRLDQVGLPNRLVPEPILDDLPKRDDSDHSTDATATDDASKSSETEETGDDTDTGNQNEIEPEREATKIAPTNKTELAATASQSPVEDVRQFVTVLREAATKEHSLTESPTAQQGTAARQATCEAILDYIDQQRQR